jgi:hypothetical protein
MITRLGGVTDRARQNWPPESVRIRLVFDNVDDAEAMPMSIQQQDVAEARKAVGALAAAVERLTRAQAKTVDLRRLAEDVGRVRVDLELVAGSATSATDAASRDAVEDLGYDPREFVDGAYEDTTPLRQ